MGGTDGSVSDINFNCVVINIMTSSDLPSGVPEWIKSKLKQLKEGTAR